MDLHVSTRSREEPLQGFTEEKKKKKGKGDLNYPARGKEGKEKLFKRK